MEKTRTNRSSVTDGIPCFRATLPPHDLPPSMPASRLSPCSRRRAGRIHNVVGSFLMFHIRAEYTFLLIAALFLEILTAWLGREGLRMVSYPLFAVCTVAFLIAYLGVVLLLLVRGRMLSPKSPSFGFTVLIVLALVFAIYIGPVIGLMDVWFDFRKTKLIRDHLL